jgi:HEAT repeat protein
MQKKMARLAATLVAAVATVVTLAPPLVTPLLAAEKAEAMLYVLEPVDHNGVTVPMIVPVGNKALADSGPSMRPTKAFEALRARAPKAYGATSLRLESGTKATLVLDKVADADQVVAEVYWNLVAMGFTELMATPYLRDAVKLSDLGYGASVNLLPVWDLLRFYDQPGLLTGSFAVVAEQPVPAGDVFKRLAKGDPTIRKILVEAVGGAALRPKMAVLEAVADGKVREAVRLKADDAAPALEDASPQVRSLALDAVIAAGFAGNKPVVAQLEKLIENDTDGELKLRAVKALSKNGVNKYADVLESEKLKTGSAKEAMEAVDRLAKSTQVKIAGPALVGALSHSDRGVRDAAFQTLKDMKQFDLLAGAMKGDMLSAEMREQIAAVLVESGSSAAQEDALQYLITKAKAPGKILACQTYGKRGTKTASPTLIEALKDDSAEVRAAAAEALAALKDERAITPLADAADAKARDKEVMLKTASEILTSLSLDKVKGLVSSKNVVVRQMAIRALAEFAKGSRPRPDVVAILQEARKDADVNIKRSAVFALSRLQDDGIARDLAEMKKDPDAEVRLAVCYALINSTEKYTEAVAVLEEMMADTDRKVKVEAIKGLGKRKDYAAVTRLVGFTRQPDLEVKRAVFEALLILRTPENSKELRGIFLKGMETNDSQVRLSCVQALSDKTTVADIEGLRQAAFDNSKPVKLTAIAALGASKLVEAMDAIANFFGDADNDVREKALDAMCGIPGGDAKTIKVRYLKDFISTTDLPDALKKKAVQCQANP